MSPLVAFLILACGPTHEADPTGAPVPVERDPFSAESQWECYARTEAGSNDGGVSSSFTYTFYDPDVPERVLGTRWSDTDDGNFSELFDYGYDDAGRRNLVLRDYGYNGRTGWDEREEWTFDDDGNALRYVFDLADDGADFVQTNTYDARGNRVSEAMDYDGDGVVDARRTYTYVDDVLVTSELDEGDDTTIDVIYTYYVDQAGRTALVEGRAVSTDALTYRFTMVASETGEGGERQLSTTDDDGDGQADQVNDVTYDGLGRIRQELGDSDGDGIFETQGLDYVYDDEGRLIEETRRNSFDQNPWTSVRVRRTFHHPTGPWVRRVEGEGTVTSFDGTELLGEFTTLSTTEYSCPGSDVL